MRILLLFYFLPLFILAQNEDCMDAWKICNKDDLSIPRIKGKGIDKTEGIRTCLSEGSFFEDGDTKWIYFKASKSGFLTFTLEPLNVNNDIDFAFYEFPNGISDCATRKVLRCNATAPPCASNTGLNLTSIDTVENFNCDAGEDGFCKFVNLVESKVYAIMISNFSSDGSGVKVTFGGVSEFEDLGCSVNSKDYVKNSIEFYPNPARDMIFSTIDLTMFDEIMVYNISGQLMNNYYLRDDKTIDISNMNSGIFTIRFIDKSGSYCSRIIISED